MFTPLITHDSDGAALAAPVNAARCNGAAYKTRTIDDLRIKDDRLRAAIEGTGHLLFDGGMGTMLQAAGMKAGALPELLNFEVPPLSPAPARPAPATSPAISVPSALCCAPWAPSALTRHTTSLPRRCALASLRASTSLLSRP